MDQASQDTTAGRHISQIETLWPVLRQAHAGAPDEINAAQQAILNRYMPAIYRYLRACLDEEGANEVRQDFSLRFLRGDFRNANPEKGRFRDLLKSALYHLIVDYHKKGRRKPAQLSPDAPEPAAATESTLASDRQFLTEWRAALLGKAWEALAEEERRSGRPMHTVLHYRASHQEMRSAQMAVELSEQLGKSVSADWVRKWLSAAREKFAEFLLAEVAASLREPTPDAVEQELIDLELYQYCKVALDGWRQGQPS
jgi:DNA-directed RNA polymerase specialized sigma24 family protein